MTNFSYPEQKNDEELVRELLRDLNFRSVAPDVAPEDASVGDETQPDTPAVAIEEMVPSTDIDCGPTGPVELTEVISGQAHNHAEPEARAADRDEDHRASTESSMMSPSVAASSLPDGFASFPDGIYAMPTDDSADPIFVCGPLRVDAQFSDCEGRGRGLLVSVKSLRDTWLDIRVLSADLLRRPGEIVATLVDHGLVLATDKQAKDRLASFLKQSRPSLMLDTVDRMGWTDDSFTSFVAGDAVIGRQNVIPPAPSASSELAVRCDDKMWRAEVGEKCRDNPMLVLATSLAFSGPLLKALGMSGGGLHFRGASSSGKTTLLTAAASVWGSRRLISQWRATTNGLEAIASRLNDMLLPLDEIAEISGKELDASIYMLANGTGKARMSKTASLVTPSRWRLALISSGEITVQAKLAEAKRDAKAGLEVRMIDIEADSRRFGVFDVLHGAATPSEFADSVQASARKVHGAAGRSFVEKLITSGRLQHAEDIERTARAIASAWCQKLPSTADGQIQRVALRFAAIGLAGDLATELQLTGWSPTEASTVAEQAFADWYDRRYAEKRDSVDRCIKPLQQFFAANLNTLVKVEDAKTESAEQVGWRDESHALLPQHTWSELFPGADGTSAAKALLDLQMLSPGETGRLMRKSPRSIPDRPRVYAVNFGRVMAYRPD